jgi:hypothetical protein
MCSSRTVDEPNYDLVFTLQHDVSSADLVTNTSTAASRKQIIANCRRGEGGNFTAYCDGQQPMGVPANLTYECDGIWDYNVTLTCPVLVVSHAPVCVMRLNDVALPLSACTILNSTSSYTVCGCDVCSNIGVTRRKLFDGQDAVNVYGCKYCCLLHRFCWSY